MQFIFDRVENIVGKGENAGYKHFLLNPRCFPKNPVYGLYREYVYSAVVYQKYLTRLRELIIFEPWQENYHFSQPS